MDQVELKLDILADIIEELSYRKEDGDRVVHPYADHSWEELCNEGLRIFNELKTRRALC
jgi:uncharacterized protein (DUF2126 family)